jgi:Tfp pilus assembly protein PilO
VRKSRRQIVNRIIEVLGAGFVALAFVAFFGVYRPLAIRLDSQAHRRAELRQSIRNLQVRVQVLKKYEAAQPDVAKGLDDFTSHRVPSRRECYSTADHLLNKVADASGVKLAALAYKLEPKRKDPLERLQIEINAQGPYAGLIKFAHTLETADDFMLVRDFQFTPGENFGPVSLKLDADLYLMP